MHMSLRKWVWYVLSLLLAAGILALLLSRQDWPKLARLVRDVDWRFLLATAGVGAIYWLVRVARWRWMTRREGSPIGWPKAWLSMLAGLGVGLITPLRSGEVVRPLFIPKGARVRLAGWVVIERMFDLAGVLTLCVLGLVYMVFAQGVSLTGGPVSPWVLLAVPLLLATALAVPVVIHVRPERLWRLLARLLPKKARELAEVRLTGRELAAFLAVSCVGESLSVLTVFLCLRAFGDMPLIAACSLSPLVMLHNLLPATPGGFGVREAVAVSVFGFFGYGSEQIVAGYLANPIIVLVIPGVVGIVGAWVSGVMSSAEVEA